MDEFLKAFKQFLFRDVIFVIGGSVVIASLLYTFDKLDNVKDLSVALYLLGAGVTYVVGYTIQDLFALTGLITVHYPLDPPKIVKSLYKQFEGKAWKDISKEGGNEFDPLEAMILILGKKDELQITYLERTIALKQIGTTMSPCFIVASFPLFWRAVQNCCDKTFGFDIVLAILSLILGLGLIILAWIKTAQTTRHIFELWKKLKTPE